MSKSCRHASKRPRKGRWRRPTSRQRKQAAGGGGAISPENPQHKQIQTTSRTPTNRTQHKSTPQNTHHTTKNPTPTKHKRHKPTNTPTRRERRERKGSRGKSEKGRKAAERDPEREEAGRGRKTGRPAHHRPRQAERTTPAKAGAKKKKRKLVGPDHRREAPKRRAQMFVEGRMRSATQGDRVRSGR